jgi:hypothetical protein
MPVVAASARQPLTILVASGLNLPGAVAVIVSGRNVSER